MKISLLIKDITGDGNCLFRALADQLFNDHNRHLEVRTRIMDHIQRSEYEKFVEDDVPFDTYCSKMSKSGTWGGKVEPRAAAVAFRVKLYVHQLDLPQYDLGANLPFPTTRTLHISYHNGDAITTIVCNN